MITLIAAAPILSLLIWLPVIGALIIFATGDASEASARSVRWVALWTSLVELVLALGLLAAFDPRRAGFQFVEKLAWLPQAGVSYHLGVDGISLLFVVMSALLTPIAIVASWREPRRVRAYMAAFLLLEALTIGMFESLDFLLFYVFFEGVLLPMYLIIGVWGGEQRVRAAVRFFLFTLAGSLPMLLALVWMWHHAGTTDMVTLMHTPISATAQNWLFIAFLLAFGVKAAVWPLHSWLPDAYGEAPVAGTVMLAAVLSKMGSYGFLRFSLPMLPQATMYFAPLMLALGVIAIIYLSFAAFAQTDMKRMIAYSSAAHMGMIVVGIFTLTVEGIEGALFQMISHGLVIAALFLCVGVLLARGQSRLLEHLGGLAVRMPVFATFLMIFVLANVGLPGTSGFVGEVLILAGAIKVNFWLALLAGSGMILSVMFMLVLVRRVLFDQSRSSVALAPPDVGAGEWLMLAPLAMLVLVLGIHPDALTVPFDRAVHGLVQQTGGVLAMKADLHHRMLAMVSR
ncbi:MAG: NADH-quinone oxidoreductase subunit M [Acidiphilium sp.]|jgi:NADH-quinone oxidoreductase subunit M